MLQFVLFGVKNQWLWDVKLVFQLKGLLVKLFAFKHINVDWHTLNQRWVKIFGSYMTQAL